MRRRSFLAATSWLCLVSAAVIGFAPRVSSPASPQAGPPFCWVVQSGGTTAGLRGVSAVDERTAWASGTGGTVLRTVDGGATWTLRPVPGAEECDFRDIEAFGPDEAVVMAIGRPARIFRTEDGGRTWTETFRYDAEGIFLDGFAFFDDRSGLAFGDPMDGRFFLLATDDGGLSWTLPPEESRPAARGGEAAFAASGTSLAVHGTGLAWLGTGGQVSRVWRSEDRGRHWTSAFSALLQGSPSSGVFSVAFFDARRGIAVGGDYRAEAAPEGNAAVSADGGKTWQAVDDRRPGGFREAVAFVPASMPPLAVTVGPSGSDVSPDFGRTWTPLESPAGFHALDFAPDSHVGWAVGRNGLIARFGRR